ncbi:hypothetical protein [Klebsiella pasteurii]|uniref:hypothetical protein n=1 Tax=Klebsiella pasteurii TaxID=2587529 RepID=UPI00287C3028|nr:hypothetical protein [Klebsiella pasteurii]MDS7876711.1 hypothetical protein [Klebsiella pasteurii]
MDDFELQRIFHQITATSSPLEALNIYERHFDLLKGWRIIYAANDDHGPFKLQNRVVDGSTGICSIFRGQSLWVIDANMVGTEGVVPYLAGTGTYFDSNAASFIYSLGYKEKFGPELRKQLGRIQSLGIDYRNINPYLYLFENRKHFDNKPENIEYGRKTFAVMTALSKIEGPLDESWREMYKKYFLEQCEESIAPLFKNFLSWHQNGEFNLLDHQFALTELLLLETKILDITTKDKNEHKLEVLIQFMDEKLQVMMLREIAVCVDILFNGNSNQLAKKLRKINHHHPDSLGIIHGCAWDLFMFRVMDWFSNTSNEFDVDFYISNLVSCDKDVLDVAELTKLKAIAIHNDSHEHVIFQDNSPEEILISILGEDKREFLLNLFNYDSRQKRIGWTQKKNNKEIYAGKNQIIQGLLMEKREELASLICQ